jgi:predicted nucleic acid-binding protein
LIAYLDSSAIVKLYLIDEAGAIDLQAIISASAGLVTSRLSYVEVRAGLASARRAARLAPKEHDDALASFHDAWPAYDVIELTEAVGARAGMIAEGFGLRAADAIQLASALELDLEETMLVAWDDRLVQAARAAGVAAFPIGI